MRNFYKALTVAVLAGLVCYTGRSLNLQEKSPSWVCAWDISPSAKPLEEQFPMQKS